MKLVKFVGITALGAFAIGSGILFSTSVDGQTTAPATTAPADNVDAVHQQLISLVKMRDEKLLSEQEYEAARAKLLATIGAVPVPTPVPPPPSPAPVVVAPPSPPPGVALMPTLAGRWAVTRTRVDTFDGKVIETAEHPFNWVVTVQNGVVGISREEEVIRFGHHPEIVLTPQEVTLPQISGKTVTFAVKVTEAVHERVMVMTYTYQLTLGTVDKIPGTFALDMTRTEPHGVVKSHEGGNVELVRLPG